MPRYKVLKSVAHNVGHSFTSLMNYAHDDYVMGHILRLARETGRDTLTIDFMSGEAGPPELLASPIAELPQWYSKMFWHNVQSQGSDRSLVRSATLRLRYDLTAQRPLRGRPELLESPYVCDVRITDTRGKEYEAQFRGWWYPEHGEYKPRKSRPWWKFWTSRQN